MEKLIFKSVEEGEIEKISKITLVTPSLSYRPPLLLKHSLKDGNILGCYKKGKLVGFIEKFKLGENINGISSLSIDKGERKKGIGKKLIELICKNTKGKIFTATSNEGLIRVLRRLGFKEIVKNEIPFGVSFRWFFLRYYHPRTIMKLLTGNTVNLKFFLRT